MYWNRWKKLSKGEEIPVDVFLKWSEKIKQEEFKSSSVTNEGVNDAANAFKIQEKNMCMFLVIFNHMFFNCICVRSTRLFVLEAFEFLPKISKKNSSLPEYTTCSYIRINVYLLDTIYRPT